MKVGAALDELHGAIRDIHKYLLVLDGCAKTDKARSFIQTCRDQVDLLERDFIHAIRKSFESETLQ